MFGHERARLFKQGRLGIRDMVDDNGAWLRLDQLGKIEGVTPSASRLRSLRTARGLAGPIEGASLSSRLQAAGLNIESDIDMATWDSVVGMSPEAFAGRMVGGRGYGMSEGLLKAHKNKAGSLVINLDGKIINLESGSFVGDLSREIIEGAEARHHILKIAEEHRGIGKQIVASQVDLYAELNKRGMGLGRVALKANMDAGGYAWARYGMVPDAVEDWVEVKRWIKRRLRVIEDQMTGANYREITRLLQSDDPMSIWKIADYRKLVSVDGIDVPIGRALLSESYWEGHLDFGDLEQMTRFLAYVG